MRFWEITVITSTLDELNNLLTFCEDSSICSPLLHSKTWDKVYLSFVNCIMMSIIEGFKKTNLWCSQNNFLCASKGVINIPSFQIECCVQQLPKFHNFQFLSLNSNKKQIFVSGHNVQNNEFLAREEHCGGDFVSWGWEVKRPVVIIPTCLFTIPDLFCFLKQVAWWHYSWGRSLFC